MANKRGNPQNLEVIRTEKEAKEKGRKGGIASGKTRRAKRDARMCVRLALDSVAHGDKTKATVKELLGVDEDDVTNRDVMIARMVMTALSGDSKVAMQLLELAGETPYEKRAESAEKRAQKAFDIQMKAIDNLDKDNDNVLQFIAGMKKNSVEPDESIRAEEEKKHNKNEESEDGNTEA